MAKKNNLVSVIFMIVGVIVALAIGGFFVSGGFMDVVILNLLPLLVHQIVGWLIIGSTLLGVVMSLISALN